jgi:hypothetical protein
MEFIFYFLWLNPKIILLGTVKRLVYNANFLLEMKLLARIVVARKDFPEQFLLLCCVTFPLHESVSDLQ